MTKAEHQAASFRAALDRASQSNYLGDPKVIHGILSELANTLLKSGITDGDALASACKQACERAADIIIWTAGSKSVNFFTRQPALFSIEHGKVVVDGQLLAKGFGNVFVAGDNAFTPYSGMAQTAIYDGNFLAKNFIAISKRYFSLMYVISLS